MYLEIIPDRMLPDVLPSTLMIFLKHFDTSKQTLYGIGKIYVLRSSKVGDLVGVVNERMRWPSGTPLKLYEVCDPGSYNTQCDPFTQLGRKSNQA